MTQSAAEHDAIERFHRPAQIRLSEKSGQIIDDPFTLIIYSDVLDGEFYQNLNANFPSPDDRWEKQTGLDSKYTIGDQDPQFFDIIGEIPSWKEFVNYLLSQEFCLARIIHQA